MTLCKILIVDDDPNILEGFKRQLRKHFRLDTAQGGEEGLGMMADQGPYAIVVSDMQMPKMNGVQFLAQVKQRAPDTVRIMLTGNADQQTARDAVNDSQIFRFLNKPCTPEVLATTLTSGLEHYRLITVERELLSKTLGGSVSLLTDILSLVSPAAFGRAARLRRMASQLCEKLQVANAWEVEIAAMLSQVGCVTMPEETLTKVYNGADLSPEELLAFQNHPRVGRDLVAKIPRLEGVAEIIRYQEKRFDGSGIPRVKKSGEEIPLGARILKAAIDFDTLVAAGTTNEETIAILRDRQGWYDPRVSTALAAVLDTKYLVKLVRIDELTEHMILDENVVTNSGEVLIAQGQEVAPSMQERLKNFAKTSRGVREPIRVRCPVGGSGAISTNSQETEMTSGVPASER